MTRVRSRLNLGRRTCWWVASYADVQSQLDPPFPPAPAVRAPHRGQRSDQVVRMAALRGPRLPEGCEGFTRVVLARSAPASAAGALRDKSIATNAAFRFFSSYVALYGRYPIVGR